MRQMKADCFTKRNSMDIIAIGLFASEVEIVLLHTLWVKRDVEEHIPCHKRGVYGKERDNAG